MNFIIIILVFAGLAVYISGQLKSNNEYISLYVNWVIVLVLINVLVSTFIYLFTHSVKNGRGNNGVRGKMGRRGEEGDSDFCNFCENIVEQNIDTQNMNTLQDIPVLKKTFSRKQIESLRSKSQLEQEAAAAAAAAAKK